MLPAIWPAAQMHLDNGGVTADNRGANQDELSIQLVLSGRVLRYSAAFYFLFIIFFLLSLVL